MFQIKLLTHNLVIIAFSLSGLVVNFGGYSAMAQSKNLDSLAIPNNDYLLPPNNIKRELSPLEKKRITEEIEALEVAAINKLAQGNRSEAFELWFRQLRLYRAIGLSQEIVALGRIGAIAWQNNQKQELKVIAQRLDNIYQIQRTQNNLTPKVATILGISFQQVRDLNKAIAVYNELLYNSRQVDNLQEEKKYLEILGELYLNKFDYNQAEIIYEELLNLVNNKVEEEADFITYSSQLIKIYSYLQQTPQAIVITQQLIDYYLAQEKNEQIGNLYIALGDNYQLVEQWELATQSYQEAITFSESFQQIALLSQALEKLGNLYQTQQKYSLAIEAYKQLLEVELKAYNSYGVMNSYERLGQIYLILKDYNQALNAFSQGLDVAQSLNYQVRKFTDLIEQAQANID